MGLDAAVMCNCFRDGKSTPPPFPRDWLEIDEEGYLNLIKEHESHENWAAQYAWQQSCCEHEGMDYACEHIANWIRYRQFQAALGEVGWQHFPLLREQLPNANGGLTPSAVSAEALQELRVFAENGEIGTKSVLVDTASNEVLYEHIADFEGVFTWGTCGVEVGLSEFEVFAVDRATGADVFRAARVRQFSKSGAELSGKCDDVIWEDLDTGKLYESGLAISGKQIPWEDGRWQKPDGRCCFEYPPEFHVEQRPWLVSDFDCILQALRTVFTASLKTGNPVRWC